MEDVISGHGDRSPAVSLSGSLFVAGHSFGRATKDVEVFDPAVSHWKKLRNIPDARSGHVMVSMEL